ncbi:hypothetical protein L2E82_51943 [Cichorium intybus]|nr:hypothetical protein L2E82_51943 [Cichorium intybus]
MSLYKPPKRATSAAVFVLPPINHRTNELTTNIGSASLSICILDGSIADENVSDAIGRRNWDDDVKSSGCFKPQ